MKDVTTKVLLGLIAVLLTGLLFTLNSRGDVARAQAPDAGRQGAQLVAADGLLYVYHDGRLSAYYVDKGILTEDRWKDAKLRALPSLAVK